MYGIVVSAMHSVVVRTQLNNSHVGHIAPADTLWVAGKLVHESV